MKRLMVRLDEGDFSRLEKKAATVGQKPAVLARNLLQQSLTTRTPQRQRDIHASYAALREAAKRSGVTIDPVAVIREGRGERP